MRFLPSARVQTDIENREERERADRLPRVSTDE